MFVTATQSNSPESNITIMGEEQLSFWLWNKEDKVGKDFCKV